MTTSAHIFPNILGNIEGTKKLHNPKDRYRQLKSVLTKAKTIEDLLPASVYFTIKSVHSLNRKNKVCCRGPTGVLFYTQDNDYAQERRSY